MSMAFTVDGAEQSAPSASAVEAALTQLDDAEEAFQRGDDAGAENLALSALTLLPQDLRGLGLLAALDLKRNRPDRVIARLSPVAALAGEDARVAVTLGRASMAMRHWDRALDLFAKALALNPHDPIPWRCNAAVRVAQRLYPLALLDSQEASRLAPRDPEVWCELGTIHMALGQWEEAVAALEQAQDLAPDDPARAYDLGLALRGQGHWEEAAALFEDAIEAAPDSRPEYYNMLAVTLAELGDLHSALEALRNALEKFPNHTDLKLNFDVLSSRAARRAPAKAYGGPSGPKGPQTVKIDG